jgi:hypothetical protein
MGKFVSIQDWWKVYDNTEMSGTQPLSKEIMISCHI